MRKIIIFGLSCLVISAHAMAQDITVLQTDKIDVLGKTAVNIHNESDLLWRIMGIAVPILVAAGAAIFTSWLSGRRDRNSKNMSVEKTKIALLHELSSRVAHCAFDYEIPWLGYGTPNSTETRTLKRVLKFKPVGPVMYPPDTDTFGRMSADTASALINFYTALQRWDREISDAEHSCEEVSGKQVVLPGDLLRLSRRLGEVLAPGKAALAALANDVGANAHEIIKANFVEYYRFAVPNDPRSAHIQDMRPFDLLDKLIVIARSQKEAEQKHSFRRQEGVVAVGTTATAEYVSTPSLGTNRNFMD